MILNRADVRELINFSSPRRKRQKGRKTERQRVAPESIDGHFLEGNCEQRAFFFAYSIQHLVTFRMVRVLGLYINC